MQELTDELAKANGHIELLTKLAGNGASSEAPTGEGKNVTINNNYNSSVFAVIGGDAAKSGVKKPVPVKIFVSEDKEGQTCGGGGKKADAAMTKEQEEIETGVMKKLNMEGIQGDKEVRSICDTVCRKSWTDYFRASIWLRTCCRRTFD